MKLLTNVLVILFISAATLCSITSQANELLVSNPDAEAKILSAKTNNRLSAHIIKLGLIAYNNAVRSSITHRRLLSIVDYSKPSTEPRFWIFDLENDRILYHVLVAHGQYSGGKHAVSFSNKHNSHKSSLGIYVTQETYMGKNGYSLRVHGLDKGYNDNARARGIVVHRSHYVTHDFANVAGQLGRSHGCFAVNPKITKDIINLIKHGTLIYGVPSRF